MNQLLFARACGIGALTACLALSAGANSPTGVEEQQPLKRVDSIQLKGVSGPLDHLFVDAKHSRLLVANQSNNTLDVVNLKTNKLVKQIPDQKEIHGITYAVDLDRIFVGNGGGV
jgi:hypothetical protein